ncbi:hypothetical protein Hdeb2414_s0007g00232171 [Helianthus debilis subsp. tardiflorus]
MVVKQGSNIEYSPRSRYMHGLFASVGDGVGLQEHLHTALRHGVGHQCGNSHRG